MCFVEPGSKLASYRPADVGVISKECAKGASAISASEIGLHGGFEAEIANPLGKLACNAGNGSAGITQSCRERQG